MAGNAMASRHEVRRLPVSFDRDGTEISIAVHTIKGSRPGPTLSLFGPQHGDEWFTVRALYEVVRDLRGEDLAGTVNIVPVCNPPALRDGTRVTQVSADEPDMNRAWGGSNTWIANQLTNVLTSEVVAGSDALVDFHLGPSNSAFGAVCYGKDFADDALNARSRQLGHAFGYPVVGALNVTGGFPGPRSLAGFAGATLGIPTVLVEIGGGGFSEEAATAWIADIVRGVRNLAIALGILDGDPVLPDRVLSYTTTRRVNPSVGGLLVPEHSDRPLGGEVRAGELLGTVVCPQTYVERERLTSPCDGWLFYTAVSYLVRPGDWAFGVIDAADARWSADD
ncbi:succinylglutamate desuccinylase/aspartoacylase family protein [Dactylosporangium roseum]|uniref:Succinylglutamate desuccinylase/aspartoacylase family protein n=1 Tax=Dactylosporangium roseum TaxID=47989 RepID=A0ABY5YY19_9ACTN|nr:succinylglutamate desuccinylase/aspartoacylase family protein [Dactylosporangium roseum]UWZ34640.1 succinylglutamate desuccinylase/aspartoacylase family protein [Dactylosporangium roseum]